MKRPLLITFIALISMGCSSKEAPAPPVAPQVEVLTLEDQTINTRHGLIGEVEALKTAEVRARVDGIIEDILFDEGDLIQVNQKMFQIDARYIESDINIKKAHVAQAIASLERTSVIYERQRNLIKSKAISQQDLDNAEADFLSAQAQLQSAQATLDASKLNLEYASVLAPISGRVGRAFMTQGALARAAEGTHLATIEQIDQVYVYIRVSDQFIVNWRRQIRDETIIVENQEALQVQVTLPDNTLYEHNGFLSFSDVSIDRNSGTILLRAVFENPDYILLPGMAVKVNFSTGYKEKVIIVPLNITQRRRTHHSIFVINAQNEVEERKIKLGDIYGQNAEVLSGLSVGERVLTSHLNKVMTGMKVIPIESSEKLKPESQEKAIVTEE